MGKILILSVTDHEEHILNKIMETIANEPELNHIALLSLATFFLLQIWKSG